MNLNFIISNIFLKLGYFIITPRNYSFGALYSTLINGIKIANFFYMICFFYEYNE